MQTKVWAKRRGIQMNDMNFQKNTILTLRHFWKNPYYYKGHHMTPTRNNTLFLEEIPPKATIHFSIKCQVCLWIRNIVFHPPPNFEVPSVTYFGDVIFLPCYFGKAKDLNSITTSICAMSSISNTRPKRAKLRNDDTASRCTTFGTSSEETKSTRLRPEQQTQCGGANLLR